MRLAAAVEVASQPSPSRRTGSNMPGTVGTPTAAAVRRAASLSPRPANVAGDGPTNTIPAAAQASASAGCSDRKP